MEPVGFAIVGGGWRSRFFLRVARELPDRFRVTGLLTRERAKAATIRREWAVPVPHSLDEVLAAGPAFVVVSVPWPVTPAFLRELAGRKIPALAETPPAPDVPGLASLKELADAGSRIQVAEQYQFQPLNAARLAVVREGWLGRVSQAQVSIAHGYHGVDLMRRFLGVGFEPATVSARVFRSPIVAGPGRAGPPTEERIVESVQLIATFDFEPPPGSAPASSSAVDRDRPDEGHRLGILDFTESQYFAWIRGSRLLVRGERGEISGTTVRRLLDAQTPASFELQRHDARHEEDLAGFYHLGYTAGDMWLYRNPFAPARLADDEIAVATCLQRMAEYVDGGPAFCSLEEAVHDHYLSILANEAAATGEPVTIPGHLWQQPSAGEARR